MDNRKHIFSQLEKKTFIDLLKNYSNIVENKQTDGASLRVKNQTWHTITREYNASPYATTQVTPKQLRRLWMNLKQRQRGVVTQVHQHRLTTGGGSSTSDAVVDREYQDRKQRANEVHKLDILLLKEKIREAKAKADLAELLLQQQQQLIGDMLAIKTDNE